MLELIVKKIIQAFSYKKPLGAIAEGLFSKMAAPAGQTSQLAEGHSRSHARNCTAKRDAVPTPYLLDYILFRYYSITDLVMLLFSYCTSNIRRHYREEAP